MTATFSTLSKGCLQNTAARWGDIYIFKPQNIITAYVDHRSSYLRTYNTQLPVGRVPGETNHNTLVEAYLGLSRKNNRHCANISVIHELVNSVLLRCKHFAYISERCGAVKRKSKWRVVVHFVKGCTGCLKPVAEPPGENSSARMDVPPLSTLSTWSYIRSQHARDQNETGNETEQK